MTADAATAGVAYTGPLEPAAPGEATRSAWWPSHRELEALSVTIGEPQVRLLEAPDGAPPGTRVLLLELACTFRLTDEAALEWARFEVELSARGGEPPVALDLYPRELASERRRGVRIALSPALRFLELEAQAGGVEHTAEFDEIVPVVSALGFLESSFGWELRPTPEWPVRGSRKLYAVVRAPAGEPLRARLRLHADLRIGGRLAPPLRLPAHAAEERLIAGG